MANIALGASLAALTLTGLTAWDYTFAPTPPPHIEFRGVPTAAPAAVVAGERFVASYDLRRNTPCAAEDRALTVQWYRVDANTGAPVASAEHVSVIRDFPQAHPTPVFEVFGVSVATFPDMTPGIWAYAPIVSCGTDAVSVPPLAVTILSTD